MQELRYHSSKEQIRDRLLRRAADFWGLPSAAELDPLVQLLIEGLSSELYNLAADMQHTESRLLEKLAGLLTPDLMTMPQPAHALLQARPVEAAETLESSAAFLQGTRKGVSGGDTWFTPARPTTVYDAGIVFTAFGNKVFGTDSRSGARTVRLKGKPLAPYTLWIGLELPADTSELPPLSFYFQARNETTGYAQLPYTRWALQGRPLEMRQGWPAAAAEGDWLDAFDPLEVRTRDIEGYYRPRFLSCGGCPLEGLSPLPYPPEWKGVFADAELATLKDPLWWIEVKNPGEPDWDIHLNTFPVINRQLHRVQHRFKGVGHIIPIRPEPGSLFLGVHQLTDSHGRAYQPVPLRPEGAQPGSYTVRGGGPERFDQRSAREIIDYLFELLRDESAAFSSYGFDFLTQTLKSLQQSLTLVEQKARQTLSELTEGTRYVVVKPIDPHDTMHLGYWTTQGLMPHQLQPGAVLSQAEGSRLKNSSIRLITRPVGARPAPGATERLQAFKYSLMTRDRIVTEEDIRLFVRYELGERFRSVDIRKGVMVSPHPKEGLRKTIDVAIDASLSVEECDDLAEKLRVRSGPRQWYRVIPTASTSGASAPGA